MGRAEYQNMKHTNCHIYHPEAICDPINPPHSDSKTVKPWVQNKLASPKRRTVWRPSGQARPAREEAASQAPPCAALKCLFISVCMVSSGFQAESVLCPPPLLTSLIPAG